MIRMQRRFMWSLTAHEIDIIFGALKDWGRDNGEDDTAESILSGAPISQEELTELQRLDDLDEAADAQ